MSHELREGKKLHSIWWAEGSLTVGAQVESLTVREQTGQMAMVPWVESISNGKSNFYNCALLEGFSPVPTGYDGHG